MAFRISGGIGDHLIAARYIRDLLAAVGDFKFDIYSSRPGVVPWIFSHFTGFHECYDETFFWKKRTGSYPLSMWIMSFAVAYTENANWGAIRASNRRLVDICSSLQEFKSKIDVFIDHHPRLDGALGQVVVFMNMNRHTFLQGMSGIQYGGPRLRLPTDDHALARFGLDQRHYVTVHSGFDAEAANHVGTARVATKCYPHFNELVSHFRSAFPGIFVVQVGTRTSQPIATADLNLIGRTSMQETAAILESAALNIDNEGGLVHLASCLGTRSCVIFGPTSVEYFAYEENINIRPSFCGGCWWTTGDWLRNCPRGFEGPRCLTEQQPQVIVEAIQADFGPPGSVRVAVYPSEAMVLAGK
ncbi:MAG: glycosyltransferase family 9 protein [Thermoguttaceae bacterium]